MNTATVPHQHPPKPRPKNIRLLSAFACRGFTARFVARETGLPPETISRLICQRQAPTYRVASTIASYLGVSPADLFSEIYQREASAGK